MQLTEQHRKQVIHAYCIIFYLLLGYKWLNGLLLYQLKPFIFNTRFDLFTWFFMQTNFPYFLINNSYAWIIFDSMFYAMPLILWFTYRRILQLYKWTALLMLFVNWIYLQSYTLFPSTSIEGHIGWLLFPIVFMVVDLKSYYYAFHGLRYVFLYLFASAAIWKFVQHGLFNSNQMSGILLYQHAAYLATSPGAFFSTVWYWLINHPTTSYLLYVLATVLELSFIVGFFTRKFDRWLACIFILFLIFDALIMRINYWEVGVLIIPLLFSKYTVPTKQQSPSLL